MSRPASPLPAPRLLHQAPPALPFASSPGPVIAPFSLALPAAETSPSPGRIAIAPPSPAPGTQQRRLSGYGWAFVRRSDDRSGLAESGQLGGSQAGLRLDYALGQDPARGLRIAGRISAPLEGKGREAAIGIGWKPGATLPVTLTVERRIGLDRAGRDAMALGMAGGVGAIALPGRFRLDAYGQAGMVGLKRRDGYVDGAASALRPILADGATSVSVGAGLWGAAQPGVSRLDVGPRLRATLTIGGASIGAAIDWRQRIAGDARPRSGVAITIDGSF